MKRANISEAKNALSALLDRVRQGATIVIEDRGVPVARLEPVAAGTDPEGRLALQMRRLLRRGAHREVASRFQLPASGFRLPASRFRLPASSSRSAFLFQSCSFRL
jgi:prevent-host-death family protein